MAQSSAALLNDPEWLAHRLVEGSDAARFVRVPRARHGTVPFLTDADLGQTEVGGDVPLRECLAQPGDAALGFLFHSAFCGSTMLVRALDRPGLAMGLSEPVILNDVVGMRRRGGDPRAVARAADAATRLLARPFDAGEAVIVKPSNVINPLAELLLALRPESRALFLYAPLETFLISVARKGLWCRLWVRELLEGQLRDGFIQLGFTPEELFRQTDLQIAAVGWLAQHMHFARLAQKLGRQRLRSLDADRMTARPAEAIAAAAAQFGLALDAAGVAAIAAGPAFSRHSKSGAAFTPEDRRAEYAQARVAYGDEIDKVLEWANAVAASAGIAMEGPFPLLQE